MTERPDGRHLSPVLANPRADRVKQVAALSGRSARRRALQMIVEGPQSVRELVAHRPQSVRDVYVDEAALAAQGPLREIADAALAVGLRVHPVTAEVAHALSPDAQGIVAVSTLDALGASGTAGPPQRARLIAILSNVRDPGNAGAAIRAADAAGADAVFLAGECVDPANPKVVRASAGSVFHVPLFKWEALADAVNAAHGAGVDVWAADVSGAVELGAADGPDLNESVAWLFGNEAWGLTADELALADRTVRIPIFGKAESLNLGTAVAVCLYASALALPRELS